MGIAGKVFKCMVEYKLLDVCLKKICSFIKKIRIGIDLGLAVLARLWMYQSSKINKQKVVFMTYNNEYICNPRYICEEIRRQDLPIELVWACKTGQMKKRKEKYPDDLKLVVRGSYEFFREIATAKVWVDNAVCFTWNPFPKKKEQFYLQTWHGSMGLKRIGTDDVKNFRWGMAAKLSSKYTDVCISNSAFETDVFRQTHWSQTKILELGHARNDILFADEETKQEIAQKVRNFFELPEGTKMALYAPTFRDGDAAEFYNMDYSRVVDALEETFGGKWVLLNRFHFKTKSAKKKAVIAEDERIYPATAYPDMQELMLGVDLGITDYSSWICDFVLTGKPGFIYASDLSEYDQERGFYYPLTDTPFMIAEDNDQMEENIRAFDMEVYERKREKFLQDRGCVESGQAAKQIVELIKQQCGLIGDSTESKEVG